MHFEACRVFLLGIKGLLLKQGDFFSPQGLIPVSKNENTQWIMADCKIILRREKKNTTPIFYFLSRFVEGIELIYIFVKCNSGCPCPVPGLSRSMVASRVGQESVWIGIESSESAVTQQL